MNIRRLGFCLKDDQRQVDASVRELIAWLEGRGIELVFDENCGEAVGRAPASLARR